MDAVPMVAINVPLLGDERRKNWAKVIYEVDTSSSSGWAFQGDFIAAGAIQDVPSGSVIVVYGERGSQANPQIEARAYVANPDGTLSEHATGKGRGWARTIRDDVAMLLGEGGSLIEADLSGYPDELLIEELQRRGYEMKGK